MKNSRVYLCIITFNNALHEQNQWRVSEITCIRLGILIWLCILGNFLTNLNQYGPNSMHRYSKYTEYRISANFNRYLHQRRNKSIVVELRMGTIVQISQMTRNMSLEQAFLLDWKPYYIVSEPLQNQNTITRTCCYTQSQSSAI